MNITMQQANAIRDKLSQICYDFEHDSKLPPLDVAPVTAMVPIEDSLIIDLTIGLHIVISYF